MTVTVTGRVPEGLLVQPRLSPWEVLRFHVISETGRRGVPRSGTLTGSTERNEALAIDVLCWTLVVNC